MHKIPQRPLGQTGLSLSVLGLGTVKFGRNQGVKYPQEFALPDMESLGNLLAVARDSGINTLDTAPAYGLSEERLGVLLKGQRQDWIVIGKAGEEFENGKSEYIFTPEHFEFSLMRSLKRLDTDYLDVFLIHSDGHDMDILNNDALIQKMHDFKSRGLVRAIGASTKTVNGGMRALDLMDCAMVAYNPQYTDEKPVLDHAAQTGKGILVKKALGSGHLAPATNPLHFVLEHPAVTSAIVGTINPDHLRQNTHQFRLQ